MQTTLCHRHHFMQNHGFIMPEDRVKCVMKAAMSRKCQS